MGGGFEKWSPDRRTVQVEKLGYNWGICPHVTQALLDRLSETKTRATLITSDFIREKKIALSPAVWNRWKSQDLSPAVACCMTEIGNCFKGNALEQHKNLCDPFTLALALDHPSNWKVKTEPFRLQLKEAKADAGKGYLVPSDQLLMVRDAETANINLVTDCDADLITSAICQRIESVLFPPAVCIEMVK